MSSSRARSRFAVIATAVPLIAAGAFVAPASAASVTVAPYTSIGANNVVGPNAGFRNVAQGVRGNTAVLTLDVSSASASLDSVDLRVAGFPTGPALTPDRDFTPVTGFSVFKDISEGANNTIGGPDGMFGAIDFAQGPVSTGHQVLTPSGGQYPVKISIDGARATGSTRYFVTVHPKDQGGTQIENRDFAVTLPAAGVRFGDATTSPAAAVSTPRLTIDSKYPVPPAAGNFTAQQRPPFERQGATKIEDAYLVSKNENNDPDKTLIFLNDGNNTAPANFIYRPVPPNADPLPAISAPPSVDAPIFIGDGTGITATNKVARNNQINDDVWVRGFDTIGNLTPATRLYDARTANAGDKTDRANDVTAPAVSATTATIRPAGMRGINAANVAAVVTRAGFTAPNAGAAGTTAPGPHSQAALVEVRWVKTIGGVESTDPADATAWTKGTPADATNNQAQTIDITVNTSGVGTTGSQMRIQARVGDTAENITDPWKSALLYPKDLITPQVTGAAFEFDDDNDGKGDAGDQIRVTWSEPMFKGSIAETSPDVPCAPVETGVPGSPCVTFRITFPEDPDGITWGSNPTVEWSADLTSVLITLGPSPTGSEPAPTGARLPELNDKIRSEATVQDPVGNSAAQPAHSDRIIGLAPARPSLVQTVDSANVGRNLYNQGRDGYLDALTVTFPNAIDNAATAVEANKANFTIVGSDVKPVTTVTSVNSSTFKLSFEGTMGSGETPRLVYAKPATGGLKVGGVEVPPFTVGSLDYAPPAAQLVVTADSNADGKLDRLVVTYSEPVNHDTIEGEPAETYYVPGYYNQPDGTVGCPAEGIPVVLPPYNSSAQGDAPNVTYINLCPKTTHDTDATPGASASHGLTDVANHDDGPNTGSGGWSTGTFDTPTLFNRVLDKAPPVVVSRTTKDFDSDGRIDAIDIVYGEILDGLSVEGAQFVVTGRAVDRVERVSGTLVRLSLTPIPPGIAGDTDAKPTVQYTGGGVAGGIRDGSDQRNLVRVDAAPVAPSDGAGPAITAACAGTAANNGKCPLDTATDDKMNVFFSEALTPGTVAVADFAVEQPSGTPKAITAVAMAADNKSATLTFANNALNPATDALVRFTGANVVTDAATPAQGNTQTAPIVAPAPPAVALNLTCPVAAAAGYCGSTFVNTGAVATAGLVRFWRLSTTARPTPTPDSEYSADQPATYPKTGALPEGELKLYLSGKDDFGRLSAEISDTIQILRAPTLSTVQFLNSTGAARGAWGKTDTVLDGDNIRVGATAFSSDVASWTASNGGCLSKHMSVDYRGLTRNGAHGAVAPFSCDLKSAPARRVMVFPFVKVSGTTKYPVGTVLKVSPNDPGGIIQDGPNGTQIRRQFISVNARRSHMVPDASVITVPLSVVNGIPRGRTVGYRDGSVIKSSTSGYYYLYQSLKRPISPGLLAAWKIPTSHTYVVSTGELNAHATGAGFAYGAHPVGTWIRFSDGSINQITKDKLGQVVRRGVTSSTALKTLTPLSHIYAANHYDRAIPYDASFMRGYRDGTLLRTGTNTYAVVARTVLRTFANSQTFNSLGFNTANALTFSAGSMPRTPVGYQTGATIDRYKITSTIIKATNLAGGTATATVLPAIGGLWAVGKIDPIPGNWDSSRQ